MTGVTKFCDMKIKSKKVVMFSKASCPWCSLAKSLFDSLVKDGHLEPSEYEIIEIERRADCSDIQNYMRSITGARSVPRVFIKGKCIGGGSETQDLARRGQLVKMIA